MMSTISSSKDAPLSSSPTSNGSGNNISHSNSSNSKNKKDEIIRELISKVFTVTSGEQLVAVISATKLNRKKGSDKKRILALTIKRIDAKPKVATAVVNVKNINVMKGVKHQMQHLKDVANPIKMIDLHNLHVNPMKNMKNLNVLAAKPKKNKIRMLAIERKNGQFNIIKDYKLKTLTMIKSDEKREQEFILFFDKKPFHILAESVEDKNMFLCKIVQLMKENFGLLPTLEGVNIEELSQYILSANDSDDEGDVEAEMSDISQKALLTPAEDQQLRKLLTQLNLPLESFHSSHGLLSKKLVECEKQNIHSILLQQDSWKEVNDSLQVCEKMLKEMGTWVDRYSRKLIIMQKDIEQIEKENNALEVMWRNHQSLLKELDSLTDSLKFDPTYEQCILQDDFEGDGLSKINKAVLKLQETLNRPFADGMDNMEAVMKRKKEFQRMRFALVNRFREFLVARFTKQIEDIIKERAKNVKYSKFDISAKQVTDKDNINKQIFELHREKVYRPLDKYETLMNCTYSTQIALEGDQPTVEQFAKEINAARKALKKKDKGIHLNLNKINVFKTKEKKGKCQNRADQLTQLTNAYCSAVAPLFRKEFSDFTLDVKATMKKLKDNKYHHSFALSVGKNKQAEKISSVNASTTATATSTSTLMTDYDEMTTATDVDEPEINYHDLARARRDSVSISGDLKLESPDIANRVDCVFAYCMNTVCDVIYHEQAFCQKFFFLKSGKGSSVAPENATSPTAQAEIQQKLLYDMMDKIFRDIPSHLLTLFEWIRSRCDSFYLLSMTLTLERLQNTYREKSPFLNAVMLGPLLDMTRQAFDKFVGRQMTSIEEYKCVIKKISVVPFLAKFPYWVRRMDLILERHLYNNDQEAKNFMAKGANKRIANKMFEHLEKLSETDKKHSDSFRVKNYMFFISSMQNNPDMIHDQLVPLAQERLNKNMDDYIKMMIDWKFDDLFSYFSQLENTMQTVDVDDIVYQTQYSKKKLKDLIQKYCNVTVHVNMDQNNAAQFSDFQSKLTDIFKRMDKHLGVKCESGSSYKIGDDFMSSVHALVWARLREFFVKRFREMHELVNKCYKDTNIVFVPSVPVVQKLFDRVEDERGH